MTMAADLPTFSATDLAWVQRLFASCEHLPQRMPAFLQQHFFNDAAGRALILQPARRFGYYYLKSAVHERPERLAAEIKNLMDLCALIARLRAHRLLYLFDGATAQAEPMFFLGDLFDEPQPAAAHLVLNKRGDYTFDPETIRNAGDEVLYRGVRLDGELYDFIHGALRGMFTITQDARTALAPLLPAPPRPDASIAVPANAAVAEDAQEAQDGGWRPFTRHWRGAVRHGAVALAAGVAGFALQGHLSLAAAPAQGAATRAGAQAMSGPAAAALPAAPAVHPVAASAPEEGAETVLYGIDVSKWNGRAGADVLREPQLHFAFARASFALTPDPSFTANWQRMAERGLVRGAYHFFSLQADPQAQARRLVQALQRRGERDLCAAVDVEEGSFPAGGKRPGVAAVQAALLAHLDYLERQLGCRPILYTNLSIGNGYLNDARFARYPLWIADWVSAGTPVLPRAWAGAGYRFWQRSATHTFADAPRQLTDFDVFNGSRAQLAQMLAPARPASRMQLASRDAITSINP